MTIAVDWDVKPQTEQTQIVPLWVNVKIRQILKEVKEKYELNKMIFFFHESNKLFLKIHEKRKETLTANQTLIIKFQRLHDQIKCQYSNKL